MTVLELAVPEMAIPGMDSDEDSMKSAVPEGDDQGDGVRAARTHTGALMASRFPRDRSVEVAAVVLLSRTPSPPWVAHSDCTHVTGGAAVRAGGGRSLLAGADGDLWRQLRGPLPEVRWTPAHRRWLRRVVCTAVSGSATRLLRRPRVRAPATSGGPARARLEDLAQLRRALQCIADIEVAMLKSFLHQSH